VPASFPGLPAGAVTGLWPHPSGGLLIATRRGLFRLNRGAVTPEAPGPSEKAVVGACLDSQGFVWFADQDAIHHATQSGWQEFPTPAGQVKDLAVDDNGNLWVASDNGLFHYESGAWTRLAFGGRGSLLLSNDVRSLARDGADNLWLATSLGANCFDRSEQWLTFAGKQGLPVLDLRCVEVAPNGDVWFGTANGAARLSAGKWDYFHSRRWLPGDEVRAVAFQGDEVVWLATSGGVTRLEFRRMTLRQKADYFEQRLRERHLRHGYVVTCTWNEKLQPPGWQPGYDDNDGLWTSLYVAAEAFRYATTGEPEARDYASQSLQALLDLVRLSPVKGMPARFIVLDQDNLEVPQNNPHVRRLKNLPAWYKGDTSSDELAGHFFAYSIYFDLIANEEEKRQIRQAADAIGSHLLEHGLLIIDEGGQPTTWGVFAPQFLNHDPRWAEDRGLNSLQILSHLKVCYHLTGDPKYQQEYERLIREHGYAFNAVHQKKLPPYHVNHSDDELAALAFYPLLLYEEDPALRALYRLGARRSWEIERPEKSPLFNFIYGVADPQMADAAASAETLQDMPMDTRYYDIDNRHCADIRIDEELRGRFGVTQSAQPLRRSQSGMLKWNGNPYSLVWEGQQSAEDDGTFFLLPYWMGRYYGFIREEDQ